MGKRDSSSLNKGRNRQRTLVVFASIFFTVIGVRLFSLQVIRHDEFSRFAEDNKLQRERVAAPRGYFLDRVGRIMVDNVLHFEIVMSWRSRNAVAGTVALLSTFVPIDTTKVMTRFDAWNKKNGRLAFPIVPDADKFMISFVRENADLFPHLRVKSRARRRYRQSQMAAHVLGYVGEVSDNDLARQDVRYQPGDLLGKSALELRCEEDLRGTDGQRVFEVNASGNILGEVSDLSIPPISGANMLLTLDLELQRYLESLLAEKGKSSAVVMDVNDGSLLAAASSPAFDPNEFATGISQSSLDALFAADTKPLFNRISQARYPPASTFKIVSAYAILANELIDPGEILVYCTGAYRFGNRIFRCWQLEGHGAMNLMTAVVQSCDSYFYKVGEIMDADMLASAARDFGFGSRTAIELPGEVQGLVPDRAYYDKKFGKGKWTQGYILNNIIGQGEYLANLLQVARMAAAVANGGYLVQPHLIAHAEGEPPVAYTRKRVPHLNGQTLRFLRTAMARVVSDVDGTAHWTELDWLKTAGKTGTAQNPHGAHHAWYVAYAPVDEPEIAIAIIVENAGHGGEVAAPIARDFFAEYFGAPVTETHAEAAETTMGGGSQ